MSQSFVTPEDARFISECLDAYAAAIGLIHVAKAPPYSPLEGGAPPAMWDDDVGPDGWVSWRMLPSTVTEDEIRALERTAEAEFPPLYRAFLTARFVMDLDVPGVRLPALPSDAPLARVSAHIEAWSPLHRAGYIAFADDDNDTGPLCFDVRASRSGGDCPIVLFDHEQLVALGQPQLAERALVAPHALPYFDSFRHLLIRGFVDYPAALRGKTFDRRQFGR
jgi:hypothetical protein